MSEFLAKHFLTAMLVGALLVILGIAAHEPIKQTGAANALQIGSQ